MTVPPSTQPEDITLTVRQVVIHCVPGLYGPVDEKSGQVRIDPASGLPFNGEQWPAILPSYMSLQGTSALDTILDARELSTFVIGGQASILQLPQNALLAHGESFIDSLTIRNARVGAPGAWGAGAGIYIFPGGFGDSIDCRLRVTNCFLVNNDVGIGVDSYVAEATDTPLRPRIVNNTFAWNGIGLWAGNTRSTTPTVSVHNMLVLNNIFDSGSPPGFVAGLSGFEGVAGREREVAQRGAAPTLIVFTPPIDTNAWEAGAPALVNNGTALVNWPSTLPYTGGGAPRVDIRPYTHGANGRGCLYVADILRTAFPGDPSPHDLRLAPAVTLDPAVPPGRPTPPLNPLVNQGIGEIAGPSSFPISTVGLQTLDAPPGLPPDAEGRPSTPTRVDGWDYDCEGFGNPRQCVRRGFAANPTPNLGEIDIGADEMGELILAGFIDGTRILTPDPIPNTVVPPHGSIYFFDLPAPTAAGWPRPVTNLYVSGYPYWWDHKQAVPAIDAEVGDYTRGIAIGSRGWPITAVRTLLIVSPPTTWQPFPAQLECDFSPHLVPDVHPAWGWLMWHPPVPFPGDIYASNPWYDDPAQNLSIAGITRGRFDNPTLFHNFGGTGSTSWGTMFSPPMYVRDGTINPPGTFLLPGRWTIDPVVQFGPYAPCGGTSATTYDVGTWGFGDAPASCPDQIPGIPSGGGTQLLSAIRFNVEHLTSETFPLGSNLQTLLGIRTPPPVLNAGTRGMEQQRSTEAQVRP
ncbi:MAG: hypothetical protein KA020_19015, partial [Planctomycetes bacterium]|nr:hypothetical protein [Planctomycetota bacterium]